MGAHNSRRHRLLYGDGRQRSVWWLKVAGALFILTPALLAMWWIAASVGVVFPSDVVSNATTVVLVGLGIFGLITAAIHAYLNDGFLVSSALALAPVVGLVFFVGDALYVVLILGVYALIAGTVGFVLGAGARRLVVHYGRSGGGTT